MGLFDDLKDLITKIAGVDELSVDNFVFKLHRIATVGLLLTFSVVVSLNQYVGDPIECITNQEKIDTKLIDTYCWIHGTYTDKPAEAGQVRTKDHLAFGSCIPDEEECWHHTYYQFVVMVLILQAACFYAPWFFWTVVEEDRVKSMISGLDKKSLIRGMNNKEALTKPDKGVGKKVKDLIDNWKGSMGSNNNWALKFYASELMNLANAVGQFFFTDYFLGGHFQAVGINGLYLDEHQTVMPILSTCRFQLGGTGGGANVHHALCVLPPNMLNQKFYSIWFIWLTTLILVSAIMLVLRLAIVFSSEIRELMLSVVYGVSITNKKMLQKCSHGDWFLLSSILDNMNAVVRSSFIMLLEEKVVKMDQP